MLRSGPKGLSVGNTPLILMVAPETDASGLHYSLAHRLQRAGYQVLTVENSRQCLLAYPQYQPHLVILAADLAEAFTCCQRLRVLPDQDADLVPILMVAPKTDPTWIDRALAAGATDYIAKPIHWPVLHQRIRQLLKTHQAVVTAHRCAEQARVMAAIATSIYESFDLSQILQQAVNEVQTVLRVDRVVVYRCEAAGLGRVLVEAVAKPQFSLLGQLVQDVCFLETCLPLYQNGQVRLLEDTYTAPLHPCYLQFLLQLQVRASVVVPLLQNQGLQNQGLQDQEARRQVWGLLIAHDCTAPHRWQSWEIGLMQQVALQLMVAVQQSELQRQVQL